MRKSKAKKMKADREAYLQHQELLRICQYYIARLADHYLLDGAVLVENPRDVAGDRLAVPVGGSRRGGYLEFLNLDLAEKALALLEGYPGFPDLRIIDLPDKYDHDLFVLAWGERQTRIMTAEELGRYHGYTAEAIEEEIGHFKE
jgi:hypothetical protein